MSRFKYPVILTAVGVMSIYDSFSNGSNAEAFRTRAEIATLAPITRYTHVQRRRNSHDEATLSFLTRKGEKIVLENHTVPTGIISSHKGAGIKVQYLPESPRTIQFIDAPETSPKTLMAIGWIAMVLGVIWLVVAARSPAQDD